MTRRRQALSRRSTATRSSLTNWLPRTASSRSATANGSRPERPSRRVSRAANARLNRGQRASALVGILDRPEGITATYAALPLARQQAVIKAVLEPRSDRSRCAWPQPVRFEPDQPRMAGRICPRFALACAQQRCHLSERRFILDLWPGALVRPTAVRSRPRSPRILTRVSRTLLSAMTGCTAGGRRWSGLFLAPSE